VTDPGPVGGLLEQPNLRLDGLNLTSAGRIHPLGDTIRTDAAEHGPSVYRLHAALLDIKPAIWREFSIDTSDTLLHFHRTLQVLFDWQESHSYAFSIKDMEFSDPTNLGPFSGVDPRGVVLHDLQLEQGDSLLYWYGSEDEWEVELRLDGKESRPAGSVYPRCQDGSLAGPPEDCGGPPGYKALLTALRNPRHPDHKSARTWVGDWDPEVFDARGLTSRLAGLSRPSARRSKRGRSTDIPEPDRISIEWQLRSFCRAHSRLSLAEPRFYMVSAFKNFFTLIRIEPVCYEDGYSSLGEAKVARFQYLPATREWRLSWPNGHLGWFSAWHTGPKSDIGPLLADVAQAEAGEPVTGDLAIDVVDTGQFGEYDGPGHAREPAKTRVTDGQLDLWTPPLPEKSSS
jgi:hypothetical protein